VWVLTAAGASCPSAQLSSIAYINHQKVGQEKALSLNQKPVKSNSFTQNMSATLHMLEFFSNRRQNSFSQSSGGDQGSIPAKGSIERNQTKQGIHWPRILRGHRCQDDQHLHPYESTSSLDAYEKTGL
jgi:hypothetical protein